MSDRKLAKAIQTLFRQVTRLSRTLSRALIAWLLRVALVANRRTRPVAGFVLPTTVLLILVVSLTAGALSYRAFNTSTRTINETQNRVIYNAATPAIDRARAKMEFLFDANKDTRFPGGVPSTDYLASMLLNNGSKINGQQVQPLTLGGQDPYTLPDELAWGQANGFSAGRLDVNGDGTVDNAWAFLADTDGDGTNDATVVYSIALSAPLDSGAVFGWQRLVGLKDSDKAKGIAGSDPQFPLPFSRTGPLSNSPSSSKCKPTTTTGSTVDKGWYQDTSNTSVLRKNFQVDAFVLPQSATLPGGSNNFATLEFQQDRVLNRGNKWGAWFRNDLEIFPGPEFQWNGAMHTEGSLLLGGGSSFSAYLISSPASCLWYKSASEITVTDIDSTKSGGTDNYQGQMISGTLKDNDPNNGNALIYIWGQNSYSSTRMTSGNDSVANGKPYDVSIDPDTVQRRNGYQTRNGGTNRVGVRDANYDLPTATLKERIFNRSETAPYVDDTYRADDRYGPKQKYSAQTQIPTGRQAGSLILATDNVSVDPVKQPLFAKDLLIPSDPTTGSDAASVGLDGYWERRARNQGLRVLVGQRLELGNTYGWVPPQDRPALVVGEVSEQDYLQKPAPALTLPTGTNVAATIGDGDYLDQRARTGLNYATSLYVASTDPNAIDPDISDNEGDPLYPPHSTNPLSHEARQRRTLRDNLAAVQSTAVYHGAVDKDYPVACMASVVHPGSPLLLQQSLNFVPTVFVDSTATGTNPANNANPSTIDTALMTDFFNGRGTDGWEFDSPGGSKSAFLTDIADANSPLRIALQNLAQFAGDHVSDDQTGAFPPTQKNGEIHPDPEFSMWGNFSNLRRTLVRLNADGYDKLSVADKTYLHTAACTIGMLAYNVDRVQRFDPTNYKNDISRNGLGRVVQELGGDLFTLMNGVVNESAYDFEVLPKGRLAAYDYDPNGTPIPGVYDPRDYDRVPAEAYLGKLREFYAASNPSVNPSNNPRYRLAELIFAHFQIRRDRTFGFRPSPAANTWNYNPFAAYTGSGLTLWSSACDPNIFAYDETTETRKTGPAGAIAASNSNDPALSVRRLGLSRLCGTVIPPGAVRDYPGDTGFPAREGSDFSTGVTPGSPNKITDFIPRQNASTFFTGISPAKSPDAFAFTPPPAASQTSNLNKDTFPYTANSSVGTLNDNGYPYLTASVAPKWPSLYYLFPEVEHGHKGAVYDTGSFAPGAGGLGTLTPDRIGAQNGQDNDGNAAKNWEDDVDYRQPTGQLAYPIASDASTYTGVIPLVITSNILPAALQPWAEPYITDSYINAANQTVVYKPVDTLTPPIIDTANTTQYNHRGYVQPLTVTDTKASTNPKPTLTFQYKTFGNPLPDRSVARLVLKPRKLPSTGFTNPLAISGSEFTTWQLPITTLPANPPVQNTPPNRITAPNGYNIIGTTAVIPFLDRALFNGREWQTVRVMDVDLGLLRRTRPGSQNAANADSYAPNDAWLPVSGIVYAFREDAVREDAINRPDGGKAYTDLRDPTTQTDPKLDKSLISVKPTDGVPDPDRRPYGFRLRNGTQLKRHTDLSIDPKDNIRGLSFFTDDPVYIMGYFNLHQKNNGEDVNDPTDKNIRLEEFTVLLPSTGGYSESQFYGDRETLDNDFADRDKDLWRPAEILADGVSIISNTFCDGSILDTFMTTGSGSGATIDQNTYDGRNKTDSGANFPVGFFPYRASAGNTGGVSVYTTTNSALYGVGCTNDNNGRRTSFLNQNRPSVDLPGGTGGNWGWLRENPADIFSPIKVSRNGDGLGIQTQVNARAAATGEGLLKQKPLMPIPYTSSPLNGGYFKIDDGRPLQDAQATRVNTIMVSSLVPSRNGQSYGGLHNFPRFLESWKDGGVPLWFAGSFLQLSFSNYATAPFDSFPQEPPTPTDPKQTIPGGEQIAYYKPPARLWGYDVALQKSPAGPAAARFVTATKERNEFYQEPAVNDPYIRNLCLALPDALFPNSKCPS